MKLLPKPTPKPRSAKSERPWRTGFEDAIHRFASWLETEDRPVAIKKELLSVVGRLLPASRRELLLPGDDARDCRDHDSGSPGNLGGQPARNRRVDARKRGKNPAENCNPGNGMTHPARSGLRTAGWVEEIPLKWARAEFGRLRVTGFDRDRPAYRRQLTRRLKTICALAACALESLRPGLEWPGDSAKLLPLDMGPDSPGTMGAGDSDCGAHYPKMLHDATFLNAVLPFAIGQAQRHREPLSLVCVAIDRLHGIQELLGRAAADNLIRCVGEMVLSVIRTSDVVARLDDDRVVAILPRACAEGALRISKMICQKVADRHWPIADQPGMRITVSVGSATFPSSAVNVFSLFEAADDALAQAQARGRNQAAQAPRIAVAVAPLNEPVVAQNAV